MRNAPKPGQISLNNLITRLRDGRYVIPDFQRDFEWKPWAIRDLMGSIFRDYYVGSLLLWKGSSQNFDALSCQPIYGHEGSTNREYIVLDGQQRLTAIHYALISPDVTLPQKKSRAFYFIRVDKYAEDDFDDAFDYQWATKPWNQLMAKVDEQYERHLFPLAVIGKGGFALANWAQGYERFWQARKAAAEQSGDEMQAAVAERYVEYAQRFGIEINDTLDQYQVSFVELDQELPIGKICDIFTQINSKGEQLDIFDLMNAMLKPRAVQLKSLWRDAEKKLSAAPIEKMNIYLLQVMSITRQDYCSPKYLSYLLPGEQKTIRTASGSRESAVLVADAEDFNARWHAAVDAMSRAMSLLQHPQEYGVSRWTYLPYKSILPVFASLHATIRALSPDRQLSAQRKFRLWYWASVFTNQYSASSESKSARDFQEFNAWLDNDAQELSAIKELRDTFQTLPIRAEVKKGSSRYNGVFNLYVVNGARDWISGSIPQPDVLQDHHIIPQSWGANVPDDQINSILNRCPLTAETNRDVIRDRLPNSYLPELIAKNGEQHVRNILESHFISAKAFDILLREPFTAVDYDEFLTERNHNLAHRKQDSIVRRNGRRRVAHDSQQSDERQEYRVAHRRRQRLPAGSHTGPTFMDPGRRGRNGHSKVVCSSRRGA